MLRKKKLNLKLLKLKEKEIGSDNRDNKCNRDIEYNRWLIRELFLQ